jgi:hypothetical protein
MKKLTILLVVYCALLCSVKTCEKEANIDAKDSLLECSTDDDCTEITQGCCSCREGGKNMAIGKKSAKKYERLQNCQDIMCAQVISNDETCGQKAHCIEGQCLLR